MIDIFFSQIKMISMKVHKGHFLSCFENATLILKQFHKILSNQNKRKKGIVYQTY